MSVVAVGYGRMAALQVGQKVRLVGDEWDKLRGEIAEVSVRGGVKVVLTERGEYYYVAAGWEVEAVK